MKLLGIFGLVLGMGYSVKNFFQTRKTVDFANWLLEIEEASLFLSSREKQLAKDVFKEAECQVQSRGLPTCGDEDAIFQKMTLVKESLQIIIRNFEMCKKAKDQFVREYPRWQDARSQSIKTLQTIGNYIHHNRLKRNIATLVGNCTSLLGGGFLMASAALTPFTLVPTAPLAIAGGVMTSLGSAMSTGTFFTELRLLKIKIDKAKEIVDKDKLSVVYLKECLITSNSMSEALNSILSIDPDNTIRNNLEKIKEFSNLAVQMPDSARRNTYITEFVKFALGNLSSQFLLANIFPRLLGLLVILGIQCNINHIVFTRGYTSTITWETATNNVLPIATVSLGLLQPVVIGIFWTDPINAQKAVETIVICGLIAGIGMSINVANIVLTSIDVRNGSVSQEGLKILEAANEMKEEADVFNYILNLLNS